VIRSVAFSWSRTGCGRNDERATEFIESPNAEHVPCPDLVILDLNLPGKAGREVLGRARCKQVPVVVLTSWDQKDRDEAINLGASRYFQEPSRLSEFLKMDSIFREMLGGSAD
jgi:DNA-binding response OmpR family regulator